MTHNPEAINMILDCRIAERTHVEGDHHIYTGMPSRTGNVGQPPVISIPFSKSHAQVLVRRHVFERKVRALEDDERVFLTCREPDCINPAHLVAIARKMV